jgi:hypothetical protein
MSRFVAFLGQFNIVAKSTVKFHKMKVRYVATGKLGSLAVRAEVRALDCSFPDD